MTLEVYAAALRPIPIAAVATQDILKVLQPIWQSKPEMASRLRRREHRVPLSGAALAIIERLAALRQSAFIFPGLKRGKPLSNMVLAMLLRRMG